jgi:HPt (histidine-containing phosphotransfer) domain-containing protein
MTANAMAEDRDACFAAGMDDYLAKPIRPDELAEALSRVDLRRANGEGTADAVGAGLDAGALENLRELGGDDFLAEVIDTFVADAPGILAMLRRSIAEEDAGELRRMAHTLKSNGATFGALTFSDLCRELEQRAKDGRLTGATDLADRIDREYGMLEEQLAALRRSPTS